MSCSGSASDDDEPGVDSTGQEEEMVVWDFTEPQTAEGLGSAVDDFVELDGPASVRVVFPSGREISGTFGRGALGMTAVPPTAGNESGVINEVILLESPVTTAEDLRASGEQFIDEWGPATYRDRQLEDFLDDFDEFMASTPAPVDFNDFAPIGSNVLSFGAAEQDGIEPYWAPRFTFDAITIRDVLKFDPGVS